MYNFYVTIFFLHHAIAVDLAICIQQKPAHWQSLTGCLICIILFFSGYLKVKVSSLETEYVSCLLSSDLYLMSQLILLKKTLYFYISFVDISNKNNWVGQGGGQGWINRIDSRHMRLFHHKNSEIPSYSKPSTIKYRIAQPSIQGNLIVSPILNNDLESLLH